MGFDTNYDKLDIHTLTNILLNPDNEAEVHLAALSALTRMDSLERTSRLIQVMENLVRYPDRYDQEVMEEVIDVLATDPDADATVAMIELLPGVLSLGVSGNDELNPEFREYYYSALLTRQRHEDLEVWAEMLPSFETKTLLATMLDPIAAPLVDAIDPLELIRRKEEPERTRTFITLINEIIKRRGDTHYITEALRALHESRHEPTAQKAIESYAESWNKAKKNGQRRLATMFERILKVLDQKPRSAAEKLLGKRPWAS
jgi:hypothetical protein